MPMLMPQMNLVAKVLSNYNLYSFHKWLFVLGVMIINSEFALSAGKSALHWAAAVNNVEAAVVLLKNGANKDMQDNKVCEMICI